VDLLIHKSVLGTAQHLMTNPEDATIQWRTDIPAYAWVVGEDSHPNSIEALIHVLGEKPIDLFPRAHIQAFEEICPDGMCSDIPWRWILSDDQYMDRLNMIIEKSRINVCALEDSNYDQTYKTIRKFLLSLSQPLINVDRLNGYIKANDKGMTVEASLRSFLPKGSRAHKIVYDQAGTATGRLTVKSGPRILTLPSRYRDIIKPDPGCEVVQIDLVSAEPRTALYVAGKQAEGDVYSTIAQDLGLDVERDVVKVASLSALYGAGSSSLSNLLGSKVLAKRVIERLRDHFGVRRVESQLLSDMKSHGFITNLFGRKLMTRPDEIQKGYSHFMQSTTSDAAISMFSVACNLMAQQDENFKPYYLIHDALVCQMSSSKRKGLQALTSRLELEGVGFYETKMTSISDN